MEQLKGKKKIDSAALKEERPKSQHRKISGFPPQQSWAVPGQAGLPAPAVEDAGPRAGGAGPAGLSGSMRSPPDGGHCGVLLL